MGLSLSFSRLNSSDLDEEEVTLERRLPLTIEFFLEDIGGSWRSTSLKPDRLREIPMCCGESGLGTWAGISGTFSGMLCGLLELELAVEAAPPIFNWMMKGERRR
jgi:hypothetical protein